jgi:hypothetical protein
MRKSILVKNPSRVILLDPSYLLYFPPFPLYMFIYICRCLYIYTILIHLFNLLQYNLDHYTLRFYFLKTFSLTFSFIMLHFSPRVITKGKFLNTKTMRNYKPIFLKYILRMGKLDSSKSLFQRYPFDSNTDRFVEGKLHLSEKLNTIHPNLKISFWSVLLSEPGGLIQREHTDYPSDLPFPVFSGIRNVDDDTTLHIRGSARTCVSIWAG